jgi:phosphomevalonate kinase
VIYPLTNYAELEKRKLSITRDALKQLPRFCSTDGRLNQVHKTGLGSSAALTTSLVAAVLRFFDICQPESPNGHFITHNLAQTAHCYAQGKIGSGFDVSSAVFAGHAYRRFSPEILRDFLAASEEEQYAQIASLVNDSERRWNSVVDTFRLPPGLTLLMADVNAGSHTPSMVSKVLAWRKADLHTGKWWLFTCKLLRLTDCDIATKHWQELDQYNEQTLQLLCQLHDLYQANAQVYHHDLAACRMISASQVSGHYPLCAMYINASLTSGLNWLIIE